jgi:hypothetical protein
MDFAPCLCMYLKMLDIQCGQHGYGGAITAKKPAGWASFCAVTG